MLKIIIALSASLAPDFKTINRDNKKKQLNIVNILNAIKGFIFPTTAL